MPGFVLYEGLSEIDHKTPVVVIITTGVSANVKTGDMHQVWILCQNENPIEANKQNVDVAICGGCAHRGMNGKERSCYVNLGQAPLGIFKAYKRGVYPFLSNVDYKKTLGTKAIRIGAYGDPSAVPLCVWNDLTALNRGTENEDNWTAYTSQWKHAPEGFEQFAMASVGSQEDRKLAKSMGYRTFRVLSPDQAIEAGEFECPASIDTTIKCKNCRACNGAGDEEDVAIYAHGTGKGYVAKRNKQRSLLAALAEQPETLPGCVAAVPAPVAEVAP